MVQISRKDLERLAIGFGIADFLTEGRLSAPIARGTKAALKRAAPAIARGIIRYGPTVALTAARVTPTPLAAAAVGAAAVQNRELIRDVAGNVYERVQPTAQEFGSGVIERLRDPDNFIPVESGQQPALEKVFGLPSGKPRRKIRSKFNKAVKAGMAAVKNSTSYGKKGTINNAKRAFSAVTKVASKVNRGKKVSAKGVTGTIARAVRKIL
tara:strand:+ start:697 stop:1329 length:633 start_codon:yes stop_codon:yes gene_type:complete